MIHWAWALLVTRHVIQLHVYICSCFTLGFIQFFFLCLCLCRSSAARVLIDKAALWQLSERTPATAVATRTEKLLCDFQKPHTKSFSGVRLAVYGSRENRMTDQIMVTLISDVKYTGRSFIYNWMLIADTRCYNKHLSLIICFKTRQIPLKPLTVLRLSVCVIIFSLFSLLGQALSVYFCNGVLCCRP